MKNRTHWLVLLFISFSMHAQDFQINHYRAADGLSSDLIKSVEQDSLGFLWIASDDGLIRFDGVEFVHYPGATPSSYIKDLLKLPDGRLLAIHDLGVAEIENRIDTVIFHSFLEGNRRPSENKLWYPKNGYVDGKGNIWFSEPQSIVRYDEDSFERFEFEEEDNSTSFIRSFNFVQLNRDSLLISSFPGNYFLYHYPSRKLSKLRNDQERLEIFHLHKNGDRIFVAATEGLFELSLKGSEVSIWQIDDRKVYSRFADLGGNWILATSFQEDAVILELEDEGFTIRKIPQTNYAINQVFKSKDESLWLSSEKGLINLNPMLFQKIELDKGFVYTECITADPESNTVYVLSKEHIRKVDLESMEVSLEFYNKGGYFLSGAILEEELWVSNGFELWNIHNGKVKTKVDLRDYGRFVFDVHIDQEKQIWISQEAGTGVLKIDPQTGDIREYANMAGMELATTAIQSDENGIYFSTGDPDAYLFYKPYGSDEIVKISHQIPEAYRNEFTIEDIEIREDVIWMGTSHGLMKHSETGVEVLNFNADFDKKLVRTMEFDGNELWFGTQNGLINYDMSSGDYFQFTENTGLPTNNVNEESVLLFGDYIWVGTPGGLAFSDIKNKEKKETVSPLILDLKVNGSAVNLGSQTKTLPYDSYMELTFTSLSFPAGVIEYSYRIPELDEKWSQPAKSNLAEFSGLKYGNYTFEVKAKKAGNNLWSEATSYPFSVEKSFFRTVPFYMAIGILVLISGLAARMITRFYMKKRQDYLESEVLKRTLELERTNKMLSDRNEELDQFVYSASHDLSAPLKSLLGLINVMKVDKSQHSREDLMVMMENSVIKLDSFIKEIVDYSRNSRVEIHREAIDLHEITGDILDNLSFDPNFSELNIKVDIDEGQKVFSDPVRTKIIFNNLISNGIKFQDPAKNQRFLTIDFKEDKTEYLYSFKDNGVGIEGDNLSRIFEMFYRANQDVTHGSGLGLYITRECVRRLNGEIKVSSRKGEGTTFEVAIPKNGTS